MLNNKIFSSLAVSGILICSTRALQYATLTAEYSKEGPCVGEWDDLTKRLIKDYARDFLTFVLPKAQFVDRLPEEVQSLRRHADGVFLGSMNGRPVIVHIEIQRNNDYTMGKRLVLYNALISMQNDDLPVYSCVIYLRRHGNVVQSPYIQTLPDGQEWRRLYFKSINLGEMLAESLLDVDLPGLWPLAFLTEDGKQPDIVERTITQIVTSLDHDLLGMSYLMAALVFTGQDERETVKRRFAMFEDFLKDTWAYQEILQKGLLLGRQEERQEELQWQRNTLAKLVQLRFPELTALAKKRSELVSDPSEMRALIDKILVTETMKDARKALNEVKKPHKTPTDQASLGDM